MGLWSIYVLAVDVTVDTHVLKFMMKFDITGKEATVYAMDNIKIFLSNLFKMLTCSIMSLKVNVSFL